MTSFASCIYEGTVVHKRLTPQQHAFAYRVFTLCLDVDEIDRIDRDLRLFSRGKLNLVGIRDTDLGEPGLDYVSAKARRLLDRCGLGCFGSRIELVCYPRLLGFVFNPLSVYFCRDAANRLGAVIYEVSNTFGERKSYVIPAAGDDQTITQTCAKEMYVSPFTSATGSYGFHCTTPSDRIVIGVNFRESGRPVLKTHFRGDRRPLTDRMIVQLLARYPLMTLKVLGAINFEAARLWSKGIPLVTRHASPPYSFTIVEQQARGAHHA